MDARERTGDCGFWWRRSCSARRSHRGTMLRFWCVLLFLLISLSCCVLCRHLAHTRVLARHNCPTAKSFAGGFQDTEMKTAGKSPHLVQSIVFFSRPPPAVSCLFGFFGFCLGCPTGTIQMGSHTLSLARGIDNTIHTRPSTTFLSLFRSPCISVVRWPSIVVKT